MNEKLALVLVGREEDRKLKEVLPHAGWVELRVDQFLSLGSEDELIPWVERVRENTSGRLIATVRWFREQGNPAYRISDSDRQRLYQVLLPLVDYLDVEIKSALARKLVELSHQHSKKVILSYHNFKACPLESGLIRLAKEFRRLKGDILKIAVKVNQPRELLRLLEFTVRYGQVYPVVVIPMGTELLERLMPLFFGSAFTYVAASSKTAPGQPDYLEFTRVYRLLVTENKERKH
ncbi:MAG: type I 3-dehydroquinate dehydratase [Candidatus Omnitrophica bacterium]|nr:type I 3-dehydroquinate dehydratase [Candidatus Omnitrophota bacterium]